MTNQTSLTFGAPAIRDSETSVAAMDSGDTRHDAPETLAKWVRRTHGKYADAGVAPGLATRQQRVRNPHSSEGT